MACLWCVSDKHTLPNIAMLHHMFNKIEQIPNMDNVTVRCELADLAAAILAAGGVPQTSLITLVMRHQLVLCFNI